MSKDKNNASFGTVGAVLAAAGSAVGLGNIWKFPYMVGENGGGAFLLIYVLCVVLFGIPVMSAEFSAGRHGLKRWRWIRPLTIVSVTICQSFYFVVTGWCLHYLYLSLRGATSSLSPMELAECFGGFTGSVLMPLVWVLIAVLLTAIVEWAGVKSGIERISKILMPFLFLILALLIGCGLMMPGSEAGISFLLESDFSKITPGLVMNALGQCFLSLSIGMGVLATYSSFMKEKQNIYRTSLQVAVLDTLVAVLSGLAIFPAVFALGIDPTEGPELVFVTLPSVFGQIRGGFVLQILFFLLMSIAALTSTISMTQAQVHYLEEQFQIRRRWAISLPSLLNCLLAVVCTLSISSRCGEWLQIGGMSLFDIADAAVSKILFPVGGMLYAIYVGWLCPKEEVVTDLTPHKGHRLVGLSTWALIRYFIPVVITFILLDGLGCFRFLGI